MPYSENFSIVNNSNCTLYLDSVGSKNLAGWPQTVAPRSTSPTFKQTNSVDLNPTAVYNLQGSNPAISAYLHFYCTGLDPLLHVNMTMQFSQGALYVGSSISEDNTDNGHSFETQTATTSNIQILNIGTTGNGSSQGNAIFTIGAN